MHPTTGEILFSIPGPSGTGSQLVRLNGNAYVNGAVIPNGITIRGLAWANLPPRFQGISDVITCPSGTTTVTAEVSGTAMTYAWEVEDASAPGGYRPVGTGTLTLNGTPVATLSTTDTASLTIDLTGFGTGFGTARFRCVAMNSCATVTSAPATVRVCPGDLNCDGSINGDDLGDYINCYFSVPRCARAEINGDGDTNADDLGDYINLFFAGGC